MTTIDRATSKIERGGHVIGRVVTTMGGWGLPQFEIIGCDRIVYGRTDKWASVAAVAELIPGLVQQIDPDGQLVTFYKCKRDRAKLSAEMRKRAIVAQVAADKDAGVESCKVMMRKMGQSYLAAFSDYRKWASRVAEQETLDSIALASVMAQAAMWSSIAKVL